MLAPTINAPDLAELVCTRCMSTPATVACLLRGCTPATITVTLAEVDAIAAEALRAVEQRDSKPVPIPSGLVACSTCGTYQARRETGGPAVHFATRKEMRPCRGSWPAKGRAA